MKTLRFTANPHTFTVIDTQTGKTYPCADLMSMARKRTDLELNAMPAKATSARKASRLTGLQERREAGQR